MNQSLDRLYTVRQVAETLLVSQMTVRRLISTGKLSALRVGGQIRLSLSAIRTYLDGGNRPAAQLPEPTENLEVWRTRRGRRASA